MRIGFIGDIVGRPGRKIIKDSLKNIKEEHKIDSIIANGENASHGFGLFVPKWFTHYLSPLVNSIICVGKTGTPKLPLGS